MPDYHSTAAYGMITAVVVQKQFAYYQRGNGYGVEKCRDTGLFP